MFSWNTFPYSDFNKVNLDWVCRQISACGTFWTCSNASLVIDPDRGTGVSCYMADMTGPAGDAEPKQGDAVFYSMGGITFCAFIDDVVGAGGGNPEFLSWRIYRMTGPQGEPGTPGGGTGLTEDIKQALLQLAQKVAYIDNQGAVYYQDLYNALYNVQPPATLVSIEAVYTQGGTVYDTDTLDSLKTDLVVTATYSDSTTAVIPAADYTLSGSLTVGTSTITVSYSGQTDTFTVNVTKDYNALPAGYTAFDYVRNTATGNSNSAVATGLTDVFANSGYSHEVVFLLVSGSSTSGGLWGLRAATGTPNNSLTAWIKNTDTDNFAVVASQNDTTFTLTASKVSANVMEVTHENGNTLTKFNGSTVANVADQALTSSGEINLFKAYTANNASSGYANCVIKIYSYKVKNLSTDEYAAYMIPCTNSSNVAGFYDTVRNSFYTANVSSTLVAENEV